MSFSDLDSRFMQLAYKQAEIAAAKNEVPVGAVLVLDNKVIASAHNLTKTENNPTLHAEMLLIQEATKSLGHRYLDQCSLYVTLEPCPMCAGALFWAQLNTLVFAATDPKRGYQTYAPLAIHPKTTIRQGIMAEECGSLITRFFKQLREGK